MQDSLPEWEPPSLTIGGKLPTSPSQVFSYYQTYLQQYSRSLKDYLERASRIVNTGTQGQGPDIVAAPEIKISHYMHRITGPDTITTIGVVATLNASHVSFISLGGFSLGTGGNIALAKTTVVGQGVMLLWDPASRLWYPVG